MRFLHTVITATVTGKTFKIRQLTRVGNGSLQVDDADKGYTGGPKEMGQLC